MRDASIKKVTTAITFCVLMILMTQTGYLDNINSWSNNNKTLDDAEPVVAYSPATSVMYGNNSAWTSTIGPIKNAEYIALAYDAVLFQAAPNKNSMKGCPMAYNASNATVWQPNIGSTSLCVGMVGRYVAMIDDITYFTYQSSTSQASNGLGGDLYAYNPGNDTIYLISNQNGRVQTGVCIGRTIYFTTHTYSPSFVVNFMSYNVDNQTTSTLSSPGYYQDRLMVVGSKILTYSPIGTMGSEAFNTKNNTWYSVPSLPSKGIFGDPAPGVVSNGQLLFVGTDAATVASSTSGNGSEYWIYDSNNDTAWPLGDFCAATACNGGLPFYEDDGLPQIRDGMDMYFIARSYDSSTSNPSNGDTMYDLWGYSTLNATTWHMTNLTATFNSVGSYNTGDHRAHIKLAMLASGDFVISSSRAHPSPTYESAFYSPTNGTIWQPTLCSSCGNSQGTSGVDAQNARLLGVYGNTVYFAMYGALLAYNVENQTAASQIIPGAATSYLNGAPVLFGSTFAMAHHCGDGTASSCPNGQRNTLLQWAPEYVTVSDAWNLTPGQRIDGPITGGNGIHTSSGIGVQNLTASTEGAELLVGQAMTNITFEYDTGQASTSNLFIANPAWTAADIATSADGALSVDVADMDGDGDLDIVSGSYEDDTIAWYENNGAANPSWTAADIATSADGAHSVVAADMDGDGDLDIVSGSFYDDTIAWYENDGAANPSWTAANIATSADGVEAVYVADMDGDGDLDIVSASSYDDTIAWYENDGAADPSWTAADIATSADGAESVYVADMDGDGDLDIVSASYIDHTIAWYENDGAADPSWTAADIATSADTARGVYVADMDGDGDLDIVSASAGDDTIAWYENDGAADPSWTAADIATSADSAQSVYVADMDGDGDLDIVSASWDDDTIAWYENDGAADPSWTAADIATTADGANLVYVADMDGDGDLDIVSASYNDDTIAWYEQTGTGTWSNTSGMTNVTGATCSISPSLPAGLSIDSSTCTISGTPTVEASNTTYTVTANISNVTYEGSVWLSTSTFGTITSAVEGAVLNLGEAMTPITLNYTVNANATSGSSSGSGSGSSAFVYENNKISTSSQFCGITDNGDLYCWGVNSFGALGNGAYGNTNAPSSTPVDLGTGRTAVAVSAGGSHTCAILDNGELKCWGWDDKGQLGDGGGSSNTYAPSSTAINLGTGRTAVAVSAGYRHTCAILDNGELKCWGEDYYGQLGDGLGNSGNYAPSSTPIDLGTGRTAVAVSAGSFHTCAILDNGDLKCWGSDARGQLGDGGTIIANDKEEAPSTTAIDLGTGRTAVAVSTGTAHTCALLDNGDLKCWGRDDFGQVGDGGSNTDQTSPRAIDLGTGRTAVAVSAGGYHTCAILDNGDLKCWGSDNYGMLGDGGITAHTNAPSSTAIDLGTGRTAVAVSAGGYHTSVILDNGTMYSWGEIPGPDVQSPALVSGNKNWDTTTTLVTWETHPALPAGMSISGGTISGTPSVYAKNQTYTIYANQSGYSTTHELYFSVDTDNAHSVVENRAIDPIGFHPPFNNGTTTWTVSPALPGNLSINTSTGEITGSVNGTLANTSYTVTATHNGSANETFTISLRSLADYDGDGLPNDLPSDYNATEGPTPGLIVDADDDGDGLSDDVETDTGYYTNETDTGTDPLNPDTDGDGICDGPLAVPGVCTAGPDPAPFGTLPTIVGVNNSALPSVNPYISGAAFTYEVSPDLPSALSLDTATGIISGTPNVTISNTTYTIFANLSSGESYNWTVTIEILEDTDGDGMPDILPSDYNGSEDSIRNPPGLTEDLDDDNDGSSDLNESSDGTDSLNPDTDGDGFCDGINGVPGVCFAGPDPFPLDPTLPVDTDGDGLPNNDSDWTGPPYADDDDDNDGYPDTSEESCGSDPLNASSLPNDLDGDGICDDSDDDIDGDGIVNVNETGLPIGTSPTNPDTDGDGVCDGPESPVTSNCTAGPDAFPLDPAGWEDTDGDGHPNELFRLQTATLH